MSRAAATADTTATAPAGATAKSAAEHTAKATARAKATAPTARRRLHHPSGAPAGQVRFAHPSERLFAALLDLYEERWEYEPVEFPLRWDEQGSPTSAFRPDFWLPGRKMFIELTTAEQRLVTRKNGKVRRMRELYPEVPVLVVYQRAFLALLEAHGLDLPVPSAA